jgi:predicted nucleic acid-binding protein
MIVLDASAALAIFFGEPAAEELKERLIEARGTLCAPHLIDLEVAQVCRRFLLAGEIDSERCENALAALRDFGLQRFSHLPLLPRVMELRQNMTAYDAAYVALAERLEAVIVTTDRKYSRAPGHHAKVEVFG